MDEFGIIARFFAPLARDPGALALTDDAAIIPARPGFDLVVTTDQIAEGTDFFAHDSPSGVAKKALRVNLSDLAAKSALPEFYLLNIALPRRASEEWLGRFALGLAEDQQQYGISLLGGDTSATDGPLSIAVTAFGFLPQGTMVRRGGARAGDGVYVTGTIGDSGGGLAILKREENALSQTQREALIRCYQVPQPPVAFGAYFLAGLATASVDVSDGLIADLGHVAQSSQVRIEIEAEAIPRSEALRALWSDSTDAIIRATTAGDDYQIAFTADPARQKDIADGAAKARTRVTRIGTVGAGNGVALLSQGQELSLQNQGYRHF